MRPIQVFCLASLVAFLGCTTATPPNTNGVPASTNKTLTLLEASAEFSTFNVVRTNEPIRVDYTNTVLFFSQRLDTRNFDVITLKKQIETNNVTIYSNLLPTLDLLGYYVSATKTPSNGFYSVKIGIEKGLTH